MRHPGMILGFFALLCTGWTNAGGIPDSEWPDGAKYVLETEFSAPSQGGFIDLSKLVLPEDLTHSVEVRDSGNRNLDYRLSDGGGLSVGRSKNGSCRIFFGFPGKNASARERWNRNRQYPGEEARLLLTVMRGLRPETPAEAVTRRLEDLTKSNRWRSSAYSRDFFARSMNQRFGTPHFQTIGLWGILNARRNFWQLYSRQKWRIVSNLQQCLGRTFFQRIHRRSLAREEWLYLKRIDRELRQIRQRREEARTRGTQLLREDLDRPWYWRNPRNSSAREFRLMANPQDTGNGYTAYFFGKFYAPESREYEFKLRSASPAVWRVAGKDILTLYPEPGNVEEREVKLKLSRGLHVFRMLFRNNHNSEADMSLRERKKDGLWRVLTETDFMPFPPLKIRALRGRGEVLYPVLSREGEMRYFTSKTQSEMVETFRLLLPWPAERLLLRQGGNTFVFSEIPEGRYFLSGEKRPLVFADKTNAFPPFRLPESCVVDRVLPLTGGVRLRLWLPGMIYDTEKWNCEAEMESRLPVPLKFELPVENGNKRIAEFSGELSGRETGILPRERIFLRNPSRKFSFALDGASEDNGYHISLYAANFPFAAESILLQRPGEAGIAGASAFSFDGDVWRTDNARQLVLRLHRPTLEELRSWELLRSLEKHIFPARKLLFIGEDYGKLSQQLREKLMGKELRILPFMGENRLYRRSFPEIFAGISKCDSEAAVVLLPCEAHAAEVPLWEEYRFGAALLEKLRSVESLRRIVLLASPGMSDARRTQFARLSREYDVEFALFREREWIYCKPGNPAERSIHPVGSTEVIADRIAELFQ